MRRSVLVIGIVLAAELAVRALLPTAVVAASDWAAPSRDGWCGAVRWQTDGGGQRGDATALRSRPLAHPLAIVGGEFTAGAGLALAERYPERLASRIVRHGWSDVVAVATTDRLAAVRQLLDAPRARDAGVGPSGSRQQRERGPEVVVLEIDPAQNGGDAALFSIPDALAPLADRPAGPLRLLDGVRRWQLRRERDAAEAAVAELVAHDGWTARATAQLRLRSEALTAAVRERRTDAAQDALLRGALEEWHGLTRTVERVAAARDFAELCERMRAEQRLLIVLVTGPTLPTLRLAQAARDAGQVVVHAPAFEFDPQLRVAAPASRPAAAVHEQVARTLWGTLTKRGLLPAPAAAPPDVIAQADEIELRFESRGGFDEALLTLARSEVGPIVTFGGAKVARSVLHGVQGDGRIAVGAPAELVVARPPGAIELVVRGEVAAGGRPRLQMRMLAGEAVERVEAEPLVVGGAAAVSGHERIEWRFPPPPTRGAFDFPGIELTLLAVGGEHEAWLREVAMLSPPPDDATGERR